MNDEEKNSQKKPHQSRKGLLFLFFGISVLVVVGIVLFFFRSPAVGTLRVMKPTETSETTSPDIDKRERYTGKSFSFTYPNRYTVAMEGAGEKGNPMIESVYLTEPGMRGRKIAVRALRYKDIAVEEIPDIRFRTIRYREYSREKAIFSDIAGLLFTKDSQIFESTFFFRLKGLDYSVSVTAPDNITGLREEIVEIIKSFHFLPGEVS